MTVAGPVEKGSKEGTRSARTQNIDSLVKGLVNYQNNSCHMGYL
jgi:hypothetical protein